jgi:hypothetical protein
MKFIVYFCKNLPLIKSRNIADPIISYYSLQITNNIINFLLIECDSSVHVIRVSLVDFLLRVESIRVEDFQTAKEEKGGASNQDIGQIHSNSVSVHPYLK